MPLFNLEKIVQNKFNHLLIVQFMLYLVIPIQPHIRSIFPLSTMLLLITTTFTLYVVLNFRKFLFALSTASLAFLLTLLIDYNIIPSNKATKIILYCLYIIFYIFTIIALTMKISSRSVITNDSIKGGICIYMQMAMLWSLVYTLILIIEPDSFRNISGERIGIDTFYYSLVTITTLGFGDITPVSHWAKMLSALEAFVGQIFIAIFIAKIIGLSLLSKRSTE